MPAVTPAQQEPNEDGLQTPEHRSAIVFIGGLGKAGPDQSAAGIAARLAHALDRGAQTASASFTVVPGSNEISVDGQFSLGRATVQRSDGDGATTAVDIWRLETAAVLTEDYEQSSLWTKLARGARLIMSYGRKAQIVFRRGTPAKPARERAQLWLVRAGILAMGVYLLSLVVAFLGEVSLLNSVPDWLSTAVLAITGLGIWQSAMLKRVAAAAIQLHILLDYVGEGDGINRLRADVADTLEHLATREDVVYDQVDVIAYSFGSIVALDAIFPRATAPGPRFDSIGTLITVGCPFDLMVTYWPTQYKERHQRPDATMEWLNIFSPRDVFGSNFTDNQGHEIGVEIAGAGTSMRPESVPWTTVAADGQAVQLWQVLGFPGIKAHGIYWDRDSVRDESIYAEIVTRLYEATPLQA